MFCDYNSPKVCLLTVSLPEKWCSIRPRKTKIRPLIRKDTHEHAYINKSKKIIPFSYPVFVYFFALYYFHNMVLWNGKITIIIIIIIHISITWWFFTGVWVTASLLKSPGLVSVFWPSAAMLSFDNLHPSANFQVLQAL